MIWSHTIYGHRKLYVYFIKNDSRCFVASMSNSGSRRRFHTSDHNADLCISFKVVCFNIPNVEIDTFTATTHKPLKPTMLNPECMSCDKKKNCIRPLLFEGKINFCLIILHVISYFIRY